MVILFPKLVCAAVGATRQVVEVDLSLFGLRRGRGSSEATTVVTCLLQVLVRGANEVVVRHRRANLGLLDVRQVRAMKASVVTQIGQGLFEERDGLVVRRAQDFLSLVGGVAGLDEIALLDADITDAPSAWASLRQRGVRHLVVKDGERGAHAFTEERAVFCAAVVVPVVDTVGAGDAFVAGYLTAFLSDESVGGCLDRGVRAGALACMAVGDWEGAPTTSELALLGRSDPVHR